MTTAGKQPSVPTQRAGEAATGRVPGAVAIISDGPESVQPILADYAALVHDLTGLPVHLLPVTAGDAGQFDARLHGLPVDIGAIFLTHTDAGRARDAQRTLRQVGGPPAVTDQDTTAIALTAAVLTILARAGRVPSVSRVVIAGSEHMPVLCPLLMAVGVGDISSWNEADAHVYPLYRVARDADAIITPLPGGTVDLTGLTDHPDRAVVAPDDPDCHLLALSGLLTAALRTPGADLDIDVYRVCALAVAASTPPDRLLPALRDRAVTDNIAHAATHALQHPRSRR